MKTKLKINASWNRKEIIYYMYNYTMNLRNSQNLMRWSLESITIKKGEALQRKEKHFLLFFIRKVLDAINTSGAFGGGGNPFMFKVNN
jgi:hypothetical protein